jgi:hypothetical protein
MHTLMPVLAYIGPETIMPATSIIAAALGLALAFGRGLLSPVFACWRKLCGKPGPAPTPEASAGEPAAPAQAP